MNWLCKIAELEFIYMQILNILLLQVLRVWTDQPLLLEWTGAQQHHLTMWYMWQWSSEPVDLGL